MRKTLAFVLIMAMTASLLVGCTGDIVVVENPAGNEVTAENTENVENVENKEAEEVTEGAVKTGLAVTATLSGESATAEAAGAATTDISLVAVTVNDNGVIESCAIDAIQGKVAFDQTGALAGETGDVLSKNELGDAYGMRVASPIGKEWNEQAAHIAAYAVGKTVEELKTNAIDETGAVKDADLASGATVYMGSFIWAIEAAVNNATHLGAQSGDELVLTAISSSAGSTAASTEAEGSASVTSNIIAMTKKGDVITSCIIDAVQSTAGFDAAGQLVGEVGGDVLSKAQMGEAYGLKAYSGVGKEWNEQSVAFCEYITGKTVEEATGMALTETTAPAEADLAASVSIAVGDFVSLVEKAGSSVSDSKEQVKTGFAVSAGLSAESAGEKDGSTTTDISVVAVTVTEDGVIESCAIDAIQGKVAFTAEGKVSSEAGEVLSKKELGDDYGMRAASPIGKEWDEQIEAIEAYAVGKTVEELKTKAIDEYGVVADADLASGATIYVGSFIWAIEEAVNTAEYMGANAGDELVVVTSSKASGTDATAEAEGTTQVDSNVAVFTMKDDTITSCIIDAVQAKASFDQTGTAAEITEPTVLTKAQLGEAYGLKAYSEVGKEWNEQVTAFCEYITGKTLEEVKGMALTETTAPAEADLAASVSIAVGDFMGLVEKL